MATVERRIDQRDCERCGGFMIAEETPDTGMILQRCVMCGERVDPVILLHRQKSLSKEQAEKLFARAQKAPLN